MTLPSEQHHTQHPKQATPPILDIQAAHNSDPLNNHTETNEDDTPQTEITTNTNFNKDNTFSSTTPSHIDSLNIPNPIAPISPLPPTTLPDKTQQRNLTPNHSTPKPKYTDKTSQVTENQDLSVGEGGKGGVNDPRNPLMVMRKRYLGRIQLTKEQDHEPAPHL